MTSSTLSSGRARRNRDEWRNEVRENVVSAETSTTSGSAAVLWCATPLLRAYDGCQRGRCGFGEDLFITNVG